MVPGHRFNEKTPNSGPRWELCRSKTQKTCRNMFVWKKYLDLSIPNDGHSGSTGHGRGDRRCRSVRRGFFVVEQMREPFPHVAGLVEMTGHAMRPPAHRKCQAVEVRHDRKHGLVGDIVADENRTAALER